MSLSNHTGYSGSPNTTSDAPTNHGAPEKRYRATSSDRTTPGDASPAPKRQEIDFVPTMGGLAPELSPPLYDRSLQALPFLKLPAEVRNMVYDLASEESIKQKDGDYSPPRLTKRGKRQTSAGPFFSSRRVFHGLTQVCRQLRAEFRPLYIERNEVCVRADESVEYISMMWKLAVEGAPARRLTARIAADVSSGIRNDVLPMLRLCSTFMTMSARFFSPWFHSMSRGEYEVVNEDLKSMFTDDCSEWLSLYDEHLTEVRVEVPQGFPLVTFYFKQGFHSENMVEMCHGRRYKYTMMIFSTIEENGRTSEVSTPFSWLANSMSLVDFLEEIARRRWHDRGMHDFDDWYGGLGNRRVVSKGPASGLSS
ncbi:uncharacterized protein N0V89_008102 [Didymosphaeria variabile]|uniref:Uncharacterized protein n=1 Tax=Didymosphaeria variabile TaxID=1932322 RepID=A0A9W8XHG7_9PLEO|nr:uncharacterized protein N0V89_008102 [Didymosphaeria variabile]KAJ4349486.1 hypothetical protein N0V89_008102 [Didymosphaeria variabile]